eukprot:SAG25_NODE_1007_length_4332_cov_2.514529_1_plen_152_part_00
MFANMSGPTCKLALLALSALLCAARGAFAVGPPYSGGLRTSPTTSRTSRARSRGRGWLHGGRIAFAAFSPLLALLAWSGWLAGCRAPLGRAADQGDCLAAATRRSADTCGPPHACSSLACCWVVSPPVCSLRLTPDLRAVAVASLSRLLAR